MMGVKLNTEFSLEVLYLIEFHFLSFRIKYSEMVVLFLIAEKCKKLLLFQACIGCKNFTHVLLKMKFSW